MGQIAIEKIKLYGKHGCYEAEKILGGHYEVSVYLETCFDAAGASDDLNDTIDYERVYNICLKIFEKRHNLIESLAYKMANELKATFSAAKSVEVVISKLYPPMPGQVERTRVSYTKK